MRFGPYTKPIAQRLTDELARHGFAFEVHDDPALLAAAEQRWKDRAHEAANHVDSRGPAFEPEFIYIELADELLREPNAALHALGFAPTVFEPDFAEEYVCPKCEKAYGTKPGTCPVHQEKLRPYSQWRKLVHRLERKPGPIRRLLRILIPVGAVVALYYFFTSYPPKF